VINQQSPAILYKNIQNVRDSFAKPKAP
jgi:hypothetical protein